MCTGALRYLFSLLVFEVRRTPDLPMTVRTPDGSTPEDSVNNRRLYMESRGKLGT
jgi:hypothetical protein